MYLKPGLSIIKTRNNKISYKNYKWFSDGHPDRLPKKQGMPLTSLSPIPLKNVEFRDGMGLRLVNGIPCLSAFSGVDRGGHH